ncbi:3-isopropylmalate dehydratase small subunit [Anaerobium acetethylicum]|uniref:Uncharacterized protein n=1 Tax=Anaerobium acetethylicum TaxID=1619234 RepID=A0A1D3TW58_9FIRM|nr:hypothetical protein [Anaerobium acetethylicum]SCP98442.1 hypothetical protein SAMN05421730_102051 [Anaerobium acetethylicum]
MNYIEGKVVKYGDNINTDIISPSQYMEFSIEAIADNVFARMFYRNSINIGFLMVEC